MNNKYSYLTKNILLFSISGFVPKLLSFFLTRIYTGILTTAEYGVADLIDTTVMLLIPVFTLDIQDAVMRYVFEKHVKREDVFSIALRIVLTGTVFVAAGAFVVSLFRIEGIRPAYLIVLAVMFFSTSSLHSVSMFCRGIDEVKTIVTGSVLNSVVTMTSNILFLVVFKWGLIGYLAANCLGSICALVFCVLKAKLYRYVRIKISKELMREMIRFSFPLIFSVIAWWVNNASDRYILTWIAGTAVNGIYAVSYKIPNLLSTFQGIFAQAWSISAIKEFDKNDTDGFIGNMYNMMNFAMTAVCSVLMIGSVPIAKFLFLDEFFSAWKFIPPLLASVVFNAMSLFIGSIFTAVKDTKTLSYSTIIGAAVNIALNFALIPFWGAYGAAFATMVSYAVTLVIRHVIVRRHIRMHISLKRDIAVYAVLLAQILAAYFGWKTIPIQVVCLAVMLVFYRKEIKNAWQMGLDFLNKFRKNKGKEE